MTAHWAGVLLLAALPLVASAQVSPSVADSLRDRPSRLVPAPNVPQTRLQTAGAMGNLAPGGPSSTLRAANSPASALRLAEVPAERLDTTRRLLLELNAQPTPDQALVVALPADVMFDFDSAQLRPDGVAALDRAAELLPGYPRAPIAVHGHTDGKGSDSYNDALSQKRAQAVADRLQPRAGGRALAVRGFGRGQPVAPNARPDGSDDPAGRQRNRRVEIVIQPSAS